MILKILFTFSLAQASSPFQQFYKDCRAVKPFIDQHCDSTKEACDLNTPLDRDEAFKALQRMGQVNDRIEKETTALIKPDMSFDDMKFIINANDMFCSKEYPEKTWRGLVQSPTLASPEVRNYFVNFVSNPSPTLKKTKFKTLILQQAIEGDFLKVKNKKEALKAVELIHEWIKTAADLNEKAYQAEKANASSWRKWTVKIKGYYYGLKGKGNSHPWWGKEYARKEISDLTVSKEAARRRAELIEKYKN